MVLPSDILTEYLERALQSRIRTPMPVPVPVDTGRPRFFLVFALNDFAIN
jgi:hypothetical protein